ncbi:MAG: ArsR family transcriptional regulator [Thermoprotei archaeon]|nr:MAG: ArsR family transcriptional regulator [Thermoprotei archaeon]
MDEMEFQNLRELAEVLRALSNIVRLRILGLLATSEQPMYIMEIAKRLRLPYPLAHLYLTSLERLGLVESRYEFIGGDRPHVRRYYRLKEFRIVITPELIKKLFEGEIYESD